MARMNPELAKTFLGVQKDGKLSRCPSSDNCVCSHYKDDRPHYAEALSFQGSVADAQAKLKRIIKGLRGFHIVEEKGDYLHVEVVSFLFRFVDDLEFLFQADQKKIHFRSASRVGTLDFGANQKRIAQIRELFENT